MDDFTFYFGNGWNHIISTQALDHLLFLLVLTAAYSVKDLRQVAILVTAFTIGHSITLAISTYDLIRLNPAWVEFLIPLTIVVSSVYILWKGNAKHAIYFQYLMALCFGLIHGMGFANTLRFMLAREQHLALPLLGFNIGIEAAQIVVVMILLLIHYIFVRKMWLPEKWWRVFLSSAAGLAAVYMCVTRWPL